MVTMHKLSTVLVALAAMMGKVESIGLTQGDGKMGKANTTIPTMLLEGQRSTMRREGKMATNYAIAVGVGNPQDPGHEAILTLALSASKITNHRNHEAKDIVGYMRGVFWNDDPDGLLFDDEALNYDDENNHGSGLAWYCTFVQCNGYFFPTEVMNDWGLTGAAGFITGCRTASVQLEGNSNHAGTMLCRTHFTDLQHLHSMSAENCVCPVESRLAILYWAEFAFNTAKGDESYTVAGAGADDQKGYDACSYLSNHHVGGGPTTPSAKVDVLDWQLGGAVLQLDWYSDWVYSKHICAHGAQCQLMSLWRTPKDMANICNGCTVGVPMRNGHECDTTGAASYCRGTGMWEDSDGDCWVVNSCMCGGWNDDRRRTATDGITASTDGRLQKGTYTSTSKASCVHCYDRDSGIRLNVRQRGGGSLLHLVQDSYSASHTVRTDLGDGSAAQGIEGCRYGKYGTATDEGMKNCGSVIQFSCYTLQDSYGDTHKFYDSINEVTGIETDIDTLDTDVITHSPGMFLAYGHSMDVLMASFSSAFNDVTDDTNDMAHGWGYGHQRRRFGQPWTAQYDSSPSDIPDNFEAMLVTHVYEINGEDGNCETPSVYQMTTDCDNNGEDYARICTYQAWVQAQCVMVSGPGLFRHSDAWARGTPVSSTLHKSGGWDGLPEYEVCNKKCPGGQQDHGS